MKIAYTFVICDLFHYGHLQLLESAAHNADKLICGVLTDEAVANIGSPPISNFNERCSVIKAMKVVSEVIPQTDQDPFNNLCALRERFPQDEIIFVYGENWGEISRNSFNNINITLKKQSFYQKLSNKHIACRFVEKYYPNLVSTTLDTFTDRFVIDDFDKFSKKKSTFTVTTKANTLQKLKPLLKESFIEKMYVFTVSDWREYSEEILNDIKDKFKNRSIVLRSSRLNEDTMLESKAGHYLSFLNIDPQHSHQVRESITLIIDSYPLEDIHLSDQVLIQHFTDDVFLSGVLFTRELVTNEPYYIINFDKSSQTDTVTSGKDASLIKIFKHIHRRVLEKHWQQLLAAIDEIEHIIPDVPLDIEFAIKNNGQIVIFQVRPLSANVNRVSVDENAIEKTLQTQMQRYHQRSFEEQALFLNEPLVLSDMAFWNPAELIGSQPAPLAYDLFNILFMQKAWKNGLALLGYNTIVQNKSLMEKFCNKPYINVNLAFLSLIPQKIPLQYHSKLYCFYLHKLIAYPFLHDKVEFDILFTCYDFSLEKRLQELKQYDFKDEDISCILQSLLDFTKELIQNSANYFETIQEKLRALENYDYSKETAVEDILNTCEELGTTYFAVAARLAFIAQALLKSLIDKEVLTSSESHIIKQSFCTVAFELTKASSDVAKGVLTQSDFMKKYGHLRAGTYDITQPRYDECELMTFDSLPEEEKPKICFSVKEKLDVYLKNSVLGLTFEEFYYFVKNATELRESVKLQFTRVISDVLETLKKIGCKHDLSSAELKFLELNDILNSGNRSLDIKTKLQERKAQFEMGQKIHLPSLLSKQEDFMLITSFQARPNFVTESIIQGEILVVEKMADTQELQNKIIFIESADPGYHWIMAHRIKGLVTKYGGAASHMAICSAELNIPAAIGCGEKYDDLKESKVIYLDCMNETIERIQ